jgi:hypothetical protein
VQTDTETAALDDTPWYRQFWPWFIMAPPAVSVIAGLTTFYLAGEAPSMVVDDYGRIAMATAERAEREQHAAELGLGAQMSFSGRITPGGEPAAGPERITITLSQTETGQPWPERLFLDLVHPTLSARDAATALEGSGGRYTGYIERPAGRFYISLTDAEGTWRLTGETWGVTDAMELAAASPETP